MQVREPPASGTPLVARAKAAALALTEAYDAGEGAGTDDYWSPPIVHPMADAKFLKALVALRRAEIIGDGSFRRSAAAAVARLARSAVAGYGGGIGWGLGFAWQEHPADEAYLITTALVVRGLSDLRGCGGLDAGEDDLAARGVVSLLAWPRMALGGLEFPVYSAGNPRPIYNAGCQWLAALAELGRIDESGVRREDFAAVIGDAFVPGYGWPYEPGSARIDLLHACYVVEALAVFGGAGDWKAPLLEIATGFRTAIGFCDAFDRLDWQAALARPSARHLRFCRGFAVEELGKPARAWSMGELLSCLSGRMRPEAPALRAMARDVVLDILDRFAPEDRGGALYVKGRMLARHAMHVLHGLAEFLRAARNAAGRT